MKIIHLLVSFLASLKVTAHPMGGSDVGIYGPLHSHVDPPPPPPPSPSPAPDPPPAPTPLPSNPDGVISGSNGIINYTPNNPSNRDHSCWTPPLSRPPPNDSFAKGLCSVCVLHRSGTDASADYQLWARDNLNNAMGNMDPTTVWPIDEMSQGGNNQSIISMGESPLQLYAMRSEEDPQYHEVFLSWATPGTPNAMFDLAPSVMKGSNCTYAGNALNGAVVYFQCFFDC